MLQQFQQFIRDHSLFDPAQPVLLAVSGGRDSVVLMHLMHQSGYPFAVAHCNFHLRPVDCDRDEAFVRQLSSQMQAPVFVAQFDTAAYAQRHHLSIEDAARKLRYRYFHQLCLQQGFQCLLTGHHRDDSAETFFLNLLRGTGLAGLHGILPSVELSALADSSAPLRIVRPLLPFGRTHIDAYVAQHHLAYVEDSTNASVDYRRNQIRHQLMPLLRQLQPGIDASLQSTISHLQQAEQLYRQRISQLSSALIRTHQGVHSIAIADLESLQPLSAILFELLSPYGFNAAQVADIVADLHRQSGSTFLSATHQLVFSRGSLSWWPLQSAEADAPPQLVYRQVPRTSLSTLRVPSTQVLFDADRLHQPLALRHPRVGDRFQPFGMQGASRLLSDLFKDLKLSPQQKQRQWLLVDAADRILWVVGLRASAHASIIATTTRVLSITLPE